MLQPEPDPEWVAAMRPTAADITAAAAIRGWLPEPAERFRAV